MSEAEPTVRARTVVRDIDAELAKLDGWQRAIGQERELLLAARAVLEGRVPERRRRRVSQSEVAAYVREHPGSAPSEIAVALRVPTTNVSTHLGRGKDTAFERRLDGWYVR